MPSLTTLHSQVIHGATGPTPAPIHCRDGGGKAQGRNIPRSWLCAGPGFVSKNQGKSDVEG